MNFIFSFKPQFIFYLLLLALFSAVLVWYPAIDILVSKQFYINETWVGTEFWLWLFFYNFGPAPIILLCVLAIVVVFHSFKQKPMGLNYWYANAVLLSAVLGPLLFGNAFKIVWNRPRPRNMLEFGGDFDYAHLLEIGPKLAKGLGESFPSGHASSAFILTMVFYLLYPKHKTGAYACWWLAVLWGVLVSMARISQGGHFLSDVFWSFGVMQIINLLIYFKWLQIPQKTQPTNQTLRFGMLGTRLLDFLSFCVLGLLFATTIFYI